MSVTLQRESRTGTFESFASFIAAVKRVSLSRTETDARLTAIQQRAASGLGEVVGPDGGFLVPSEAADFIGRKLTGVGSVAALCRQVNLATGRKTIPVVDEASRADDSRTGGLISRWLGENDTTTAGEPRFGQVTLSARKLLAHCPATDELLEDSGDGDELLEMLADELRYRFDAAILHGVGGAQPLGVANSPACVVVGKEAGQAAATVNAINLQKMLARLWPPSIPSARWFVSPGVLRQFCLAHETINAIDLRPAPGAPHGTLYGLPIHPVEGGPALGTVGDVVLADLSQVLCGIRGLKRDISIHVRFTADESTLRAVLRCDSAPVWPRAVTPSDGSESQSAYVALETRA